MKRARKTTGKPRRWLCHICKAHGYDIDAEAAFDQHYMDRHYTDPPF